MSLQLFEHSRCTLRDLEEINAQQGARGNIFAAIRINGQNYYFVLDALSRGRTKKRDFIVQNFLHAS